MCLCHAPLRYHSVHACWKMITNQPNLMEAGCIYSIRSPDLFSHMTCDLSDENS